MKDWYLNVQEETMAPARMMQFVDKHIINCNACQQDSELAEEIETIRDFILPESKIPKSERNAVHEATPEISPDVESKKNQDEEKNEEDNKSDQGGNNDKKN